MLLQLKPTSGLCSIKRFKWNENLVNNYKWALKNKYCIIYTYDKILGLLKPEFISVNGVYVGLAPKSYVVTNTTEDGIQLKKGAKGDY